MEPGGGGEPKLYHFTSGNLVVFLRFCSKHDFDYLCHFGVISLHFAESHLLRSSIMLPHQLLTVPPCVLGPRHPHGDCLQSMQLQPVAFFSEMTIPLLFLWGTPTFALQVPPKVPPSLQCSQDELLAFHALIALSPHG